LKISDDSTAIYGRQAGFRQPGAGAPVDGLQPGVPLPPRPRRGGGSGAGGFSRAASEPGADPVGGPRRILAAEGGGAAVDRRGPAAEAAAAGRAGAGGGAVGERFARGSAVKQPLAAADCDAAGGAAGGDGFAVPGGSRSGRDRGHPGDAAGDCEESFATFAGAASREAGAARLWRYLKWTRWKKR